MTPYRCVLSHQNLLSLQGFFSENINIPHTTKHCIFPCNISHYMYYYSCNNSGLTLKTGLVSLQKPLAVYFCSHLRAAFGHSEDYWVQLIHIQILNVFQLCKQSPSVPWDTTLDSGKEELNSVTKSAGVANISECSQYTQTNMLKILTYIREKSGW